VRLSISRRFFLSFGALSLVTVAFGVTLHLAVSRIVEGHGRSRTLDAFHAVLAELGHTHEDGEFHLNFHRDSERFRAAVARAQELAAQIDAWNLPAGRGEGSSHGLAEQMGHYREAAVELLAAEDRGAVLDAERHRLVRGLSLVAGEGGRAGPLRETATRIVILASEPVDLPLLAEIRGEAKRIEGMPAAGAIGTAARELVGVLERVYLTGLAVAARAGFLSDTVRSFEEGVASRLAGIQAGIARQERRVGTLVLGTVAVVGLATLLLWYVTARRVSAFVGRFRSSITSIRRGDYDYELGPVTGDEFGDALRFTKELAGSLAEQIREAEAAREANEALQAQLVQSQKMESVGRLAGGVAHDFNNLLTGIMGYAELGLLRLPEGPPERDYFQAIHENSERAARLTSQLLAFSRRQVLRRSTVSPNAIVTDFARLLRRMIGEDVVLELRLQEGVRSVFADPDQLGQVLLNLAVNARDSMPGGGRLTISTEDVLLDETYAAHHAEVRPGRYVMIEVTDTGAGIPPEIRDKVFEPFFTTKGAGKGTGLGLAMVFGIVKQHEGHIWLYSEVGLGTTFKVYLPAVAGEAEGPAAPELSVAGLGGSETVLVVDDNAEVRAFLETALALHGYRVLTAGDAEEALALLGRAGDGVHLLLTDLIMPGRNGRELADEVTRSRPGVKVVYMSGYADRVFLDTEMRDHPGVHFLQKPVTPTALLRKIREVLDAPETVGPQAG